MPKIGLAFQAQGEIMGEIQEKSAELDLTPMYRSADGNTDEGKMLIELLKIVTDHYRNDVNAVWQRSQFFIAGNSALYAYFYSLKEPTLDFVKAVSALGLALSVLWIVLAYTTVYWLDVWRRTVVALEGKIFKAGPFSRGDVLVGKRVYHRVRPEWITILLAVVVAILWAVLLC